MDLQALTTREWDCIVIGTGMAGSTLGLALARAGRRVLFLEKGRNSLDDPQSLQGQYAEMFLQAGDGEAERGDIFLRGGRCAEPITIENGRGGYAHVPFIGAGTGGSTALYGMALERFFPSDFTPRTSHPSAPGPLPERWPFAYDELASYYGAAERLFDVHGTDDPLKPSGSPLPGLPPSLSRLSDTFFRHFQSRGLHPVPASRSGAATSTDATSARGISAAAAASWTPAAWRSRPRFGPTARPSWTAAKSPGWRRRPTASSASSANGTASRSR